MEPRTLVDLRHLETGELEGALASRLLADPYLGSLVEELAYRQIDKEHLRLESAKGDQVPDSQGIIRGTRYFLAIRKEEMQKRQHLDRLTPEE